MSIGFPDDKQPRKEQITPVVWSPESFVVGAVSTAPARFQNTESSVAVVAPATPVPSAAIDVHPVGVVTAWFTDSVNRIRMSSY